MTGSRLLRSSAWVVLVLMICAPVGLVGAQAQPLPTCTVDQVQAAFAAIRPYTPSATTGWVTVQDNYFTVDGDVFVIQGVNYYPLRYPWRRFLTETNLAEVERELDLIAGAGFNTIRIYLWNEALFTCPGSGAIPIASGFERLDGVIQAAARRGLRVLVTLNDMPDLDNAVLYDNPPHIQQQTSFIVNRYRNEPAILGWDIRNAGDLDYGSDPSVPARFPRQVVLAWLAQTSALLRALDPQHLITAGWAFDVEATVPHVDFVSFAFWSESPAAVRDRFLALQRVTPKPLVLSAFGFSTFEHSEEEQAQLLETIIDAVDAADAAGWILWTAFDFPLDATCVQPNCPSPDNREHHFGLWRWDYSPKPSADVIAAG